MKKIIISVIMFLSFSGVAMAVLIKPIHSKVVVAPVVPIQPGLLRKGEVVDSTTFTKNKDGTITEVEKITRTTIINPQEVANQLDTIEQQRSLLVNQKATLDAVK